MPVEFECPHCDTTLQAPKQMMGMMLTCGHCQKQLGVPRIAVPVSPSSQEIPVYQPQAETQAVASQTPAVAANESSGSGLSFLEDSATPPVSRSSSRRRRRRKSGSFPIVPVLFIGLAICLGGLAYWWMLPTYKFQLEATRLPALDQHRVVLPPGALSADQRQSLEQAFVGGKLVVNSSLLNATVGLVSGSLNLTVEAGDQTELVRVNLLDDKDFKDYVIEHSSEWDKQRQKKFQQGMKLLVEAAQADTLQSDPSILAKVREELILAGLSGGLSDSLQATIGNTIYPCVGQDSENGCFFVVPAGSRSFVIRERDSAEVKGRLPSGFEATVYQIRSGSAPVTTNAGSEPNIPVVEPEPTEEPPSDEQPQTPAPATDTGETMQPGMMAQ